MCVPILRSIGTKVMAEAVVLMFLMTLTFDYVLLIVTQSRHEVLESPCEVFKLSVTY